MVPLDETDGDGLNFLAGKDVDFIRTQAMDGTLLAHVEGGVPNIILRTGQINAFTLGELIYFFEYACGPVRLPAGRESLRPAGGGGVLRRICLP